MLNILPSRHKTLLLDFKQASAKLNPDILSLFELASKQTLGFILEVLHGRYCALLNLLTGRHLALLNILPSRYGVFLNIMSKVKNKKPFH